MHGLILIPTAAERDAIEDRLQFDAQRWSIETIGFGVIAAGVTTARLLAQRPYRQVIVAGIAGLFPSADREKHQIGAAAWFQRVCIDGIGIGQGDSFTDADQMGWGWYRTGDDDHGIRCTNPSTAESSTAEPAAAEPAASVDTGAMLLSVCAASADGADVRRRSQRYPDAVGEDMESFAVAYACRCAGVSVSIVRGFSNLVGQRDKSKWQIKPALASVACRLQHALDKDYQ